MKRKSTQIIAVYLVIGLSWILISDRFFHWKDFPEDPLYQSLKGSFFIFVSGFIFWIMLRRYEKQQINYQQRLLETNRQLLEKAEQLSASNSDLQQFAHIASHDLQEPLRMISGFLTQLEKKYAGQLDNKALEYIHFASNGAARMRQTLISLLEYLSLNRKTDAKEQFELSDLILEIINMNQPLIEVSNAEIKHDALPLLYSNRILVLHLFQNLIVNALKYSRKNRRPVIGISAKELPQHWEFSITDNGIGIESGSLEEIFGLFHRLHTREIYEGSGIGLAICKRITESLGGRIWATSEEGIGSTFYFSIEK